MLILRVLHHFKHYVIDIAPSAPPKNAVLRTLSSRSIEINWTAPDIKDQNGILVLYEVIAYEEMFHSNVRKVINSSLSPNITLWKNNSLNPFTNYIFHIKAGTIAGVGPPAVLHKHGNGKMFIICICILTKCVQQQPTNEQLNCKLIFYLTTEQNTRYKG